MIYIIFILGLLIGSFLNVCIYRIPKEESVAYPPSHCFSCNATLRPIDLIPVFSFILTKGKCRYCSEKISIQYPIVEILNGLLYLILYMKFSLSILFIRYAILSSILIVASFIDYKYKIIPDEINLFAFICFIMLNIVYNYNSNFLNGIIGLIIGGGLFLLIAVISKGAMGGGDVKLMGVIGLSVGWKYILLITLLSFVIGAIISILLLILRIKSRKDYIAFGPFIAVSAVITLLFGSEIINWYIYNII